jgi:hypothetical protein
MILLVGQFKKHAFRYPVFLLLIVGSSLTERAIADYAWIPKYETLFLRAGMDFYRTGANFLQDGSVQALSIDGTPVQLTDYRFWVEGEYGIADNVSVYLRTSYLSSSVDPVLGGQGQGSYLTGYGLGDVYTGVKWCVYSAAPTLTFETRLKIPTYSYYPNTANDLVLGDGDFSLDFRLHAGYRIPHFFIDLTPGIVARFAGYPPAAEFLGAVGITYAPLYFVLFTDMYYSLGDNLFLDDSLSVHDAPGTGGSYALLSGGPRVIDVGLRVGTNLTKKYYLEASVAQSLWGYRAANYFTFTLNLFVVFDFFTPDPRKKTRDIPLDAPTETYWDESAQ